MELIRKIDRIHPYPAKFPVELAIRYIQEYTKENDVVYDPFMGAGTTLLACSLLNRIGIGSDINHIGVLISKFKLLKLESNEIDELEKFLKDIKDCPVEIFQNCDKYYYDTINHWFCDEAIYALSYLKKRIKEFRNDNIILFCNLVLSSIITVVSNQESDTRYAAITKKNLNIENIINIFTKRFDTILKLFKEFNSIDRMNLVENAKLINSKDCSLILKNNAVNFILTSPPYINTYDYYLYHKHRMNWLGYDVKYSMYNEIGSRREFSSLKHKAIEFNDDLFEIFTNCNKHLKKNGHVVIVIGDGKVSGKMYNAKENVIELCTPLNWEIIDYEYTLLEQTSKSFQKFSSSFGKKEHILTFRKVK